MHDGIEHAITGREFDQHAALTFPPILSVLEWIDHEDTSIEDAGRIHADYAACVIRAWNAWQELMDFVPYEADVYIERAFYCDDEWRPVTHCGQDEQAYAHPSTSVRYKSRLDVLVVYGKRAWLADWKTGARPRLPGTPLDPDQQFASYAQQVFAHFPKLEVIEASFSNLRCLRDNWEPWLTLTRDDAERTGREWWDQTSAEIERALPGGEASFEPVENVFCPCEHAHACPVGAKYMAMDRERCEFSGTLVRAVWSDPSTGRGIWVFDISDAAAAARTHITVKGNIGEPVFGAGYDAIGYYTMDPVHGKQIEAREITIDTTSDQATERILTGIKHVGAARAKLLVAEYGAKAMDVFMDEAYTKDVLRVAKGIGKNRIEECRSAIRGVLHETRVMQQLFGMLPGIHTGVAGKLWANYKEKACEVLRENPYLCLTVHGIGWVTADSLALGMGTDKASPYRIGAGIDEVFRDAARGEGHTLLPKGELLTRCQLLLGIDTDPIIATIRGKELIVHEESPYTDDRPTVQTYVADDQERLIVAHFKRLVDGARDTINADNLTPEFNLQYADAVDGLTDEQVNGVNMIIADGAGCLTGGPGTGKTHTLLALLEALPKKVANRGVALAAPTGKAARVMANRTGVEAATIHSLLKPEKGSGPDSGWRFEFNEANQLDVGVVVVDEASMIDNELALQLLCAIPTGAWLVLVGDADQLPPVGAGDLFRLVVRHEFLPVTRLTIPHRNAGSGALACAAIIRGDMPDLGDVNDTSEGRNHWVLPVPANEQGDVATDIMTRWGPARDIDPFTGVALSANSAYRGEASSPGLNIKLQAGINGSGELTAIIDKKSGVAWRIGDRLVIRKNDRRNTGLVNGSIVRLMNVGKYCEKCEQAVPNDIGDECYLCGGALSGDPIPHVRDEDAACHWLPEHLTSSAHLAYAITTHQFQGSQSPLVVVCLDWRRQRMVVNRQHLYTGCSRFQRYLFVLVAGADDLRKVIAKPGDTRFTGLALPRGSSNGDGA